jgi:hypothetical protein
MNGKTMIEGCIRRIHTYIDMLGIELYKGNPGIISLLLGKLFMGMIKKKEIKVIGDYRRKGKR